MITEEERYTLHATGHGIEMAIRAGDLGKARRLQRIQEIVIERISDRAVAAAVA